MKSAYIFTSRARISAFTLALLLGWEGMLAILFEFQDAPLAKRPFLNVLWQRKGPGSIASGTYFAHKRFGTATGGLGTPKGIPALVAQGSRQRMVFVVI